MCGEANPLDIRQKWWNPLLCTRGEAKLRGCDFSKTPGLPVRGRRLPATPLRCTGSLDCAGLIGLCGPHSGGGRTFAVPGISPRRTAAPYSTSNK